MREEYPGKLDGAVQLVRELMGRDEVAEWRFSSRGRCFGALMGPFLVVLGLPMYQLSTCQSDLRPA